MPKRKPSSGPLVETGVEGLDDVLRGGLTPDRMYLLEGDSGAGKTTLALQFLLAGVSRGEPVLFVALSESEEELEAIATGHGWSLDGIHIFVPAPSEAGFDPEARYTMFHPSEVELSEATRAVLDEAQRTKPTRMVFDSLSELRLLAQHPLRYRRQVLALKQFFTSQRCTVLLVDDRTGGDRDLELLSISHGALSLERQTPEYGITRRRMQIVKMRGRPFREGYHDMRIETGGLKIFPRLVASEHRVEMSMESVSSGLQPLDTLLGGGLTRGTSTLIVGPAGSGKSSLATQYIIGAAARGENADIFLFDERVETFLSRASGLGMDIEQWVDSGVVRIRQVDPAELSAGEFTHSVRSAIEDHGARFIVVDSLNGYIHAMPNENLLALHLHELLVYLGKRGVTTLLLMAQHGMVGVTGESPVDTSYLADTVILTRFFEAAGQIHQAISVIKKRTGFHERTIREMRLHSKGIIVGEPLRRFQGVLTGSPVFLGGTSSREGDETLD